MKSKNHRFWSSSVSIFKWPCAFHVLISPTFYKQLFYTEVFSTVFTQLLQFGLVNDGKTDFRWLLQAELKQILNLEQPKAEKHLLVQFPLKFHQNKKRENSRLHWGLVYFLSSADEENCKLRITRDIWSLFLNSRYFKLDYKWRTILIILRSPMQKSFLQLLHDSQFSYRENVRGEERTNFYNLINNWFNHQKKKRWDFFVRGKMFDTVKRSNLLSPRDSLLLYK